MFLNIVKNISMDTQGLKLYPPYPEPIYARFNTITRVTKESKLLPDSHIDNIKLFPY
jgi:hypothetical protein